VGNQIAEKLREARALIERGWCQGSSSRNNEDGTTSYCLLGALSTVNKRYHVYYTAKDHVEEILEVPIPVWNDAPGRTQAEVLDLFDRAIAKAEAGV
jgi:hypothetical protein